VYMIFVSFLYVIVIHKFTTEGDSPSDGRSKPLPFIRCT